MGYKIFSLTILLCLVASSYQLNCYECSEHPALENDKPRDIHDLCGNFNDSLVVTCPTSSAVCIEVTAVKGALESSVFGCGSTQEECASLDGIVENGVTYHCTSCDSDKCNRE